MKQKLKSIKASAPGSIMLLGEYAVLHNGNAVVCAVDQRITVQLIPRIDIQIELISILGTYKTSLNKLENTPPFQFVLTTLRKFQKYLKQGCTLKIETEFSEQIGLASSAAVTVATLTAVTRWLQISYSPLQLIQHARQIVRTVQGLGSGADVAACVLGGIVAYRQKPLIAEQITTDCPLNLIYSGSKTPTVTAVNYVEDLFESYPKIYKQLLRTIDECALEGIAALRNNNLTALGQIMQVQQNLMAALGVNTTVLESIVRELIVIPTVLGAKISGSGLGDCIVAIGQLDEEYVSRVAAQGVKRIPVRVAAQGVLCEEI